MAVIQIDFSDVVEVSCYSGVLTRPARHVNVVADNGVQARRNWRGGGGRRIEGESVSRFCHPVMLDVEDEIVTADFRAQDGGAYCSAQVSRHWAHSGAGVDRTQVGHEHATRALAMFAGFLCRCPGNQERHCSQSRDYFAYSLESHKSSM